MAKRKIFYINNFTGVGLGGGEKHLITLAQSAKRLGYDVGVLCVPGSSVETAFRNLGIEVFPVNLRGFNLVASILAVKQILKKNNVDIIHSHGFLSNNIGRLSAKLAKTSIVVSTVHCNPDSPLSFNPGFVKSIVQCVRNKVDNFTAKFTDVVVAVSEDIKRGLIEQGVPKEKIEVIHNGILFKELNEAVKNSISFDLGIKRGEKIVGFLGRLELVKGIDYFIEAAEIVKSKFNNIKFVIAGDGSIKEQLIKKVEEKSLTKDFIFTGYVESSLSLISKFDVFVLPSLSEGLNFSLVEALALSRAVVATNVGGNSEVVLDGETGLLVPPKDSRALADAIIYLLTHKEEAKSYALAGKKLVEEEYTAEKMIKKTLALYDDLLNEEFNLG